MKKQIAVLMLLGVGAIGTPSTSFAQGFVQVYNDVHPSRIRNYVSWEFYLGPTSDLASIFVKSRICLNSVCAVEEQRRVKTCSADVPPPGYPATLNSCSVLAQFNSPTAGCYYCGEAVWRQTDTSGGTMENDAQECGNYEPHAGGIW